MKRKVTLDSKKIVKVRKKLKTGQKQRQTQSIDPKAQNLSF